MKTHLIQERRRFKESNILFQSDKREAVDAAISIVRSQRMELEEYLILHPDFRYALNPLPIETKAPKVVQLMSDSSSLFNVGPMAAVAGVLADLAVEAMIEVGSRIAIVENGGEVFACSDEMFIVNLDAGKNSLSNKIGFQVDPSECPIGIATSSATIGPAISFGTADAVTIFADNAGIADAAATAVCNTVRGHDAESSIQKGLEHVRKINKAIRGAVIVRGEYVGSWGKIPQLVIINKCSDVTVSNI